MNSPASPGQTPTPSVNEVSQDLPPLPGSDIHVDAFGDVTPTDRRPFVMGDFYTVDQMREYARAAIAVQPPAASQPSDDDWTPEQIDELAGVVRDKCGPATAQRLRGIIAAAQAPAVPTSLEPLRALLDATMTLMTDETCAPEQVGIWERAYEALAATPPAASQPSTAVAYVSREDFDRANAILFRYAKPSMIELATIQPPAASQPEEADIEALLTLPINGKDVPQVWFQRGEVVSIVQRALAAVQGKK